VLARQTSVAIAAEGRFEQEVRQLGRRGAVVLRTVMAAGAGAQAFFTVPVAGLLIAAWGAGYYVLLSRGPRNWLLAADCVLVVAACLTQRVTVPPEFLHGAKSWVIALASVAVATYQWHSSIRVSTIATTAIVTSYLAVSGTSDAPLIMALWLVALAALSRGLFQLVRSGARETDRITAEHERARRAAAVAAARRADERTHLATIHDTAAATLLAIGTGVLNGREPWLAKQIATDLEALAEGPVVPRGHVDLVGLLDGIARRSPLEVPPVTGSLVMPAVAAVAIGRSTGEALANVARHAGVGVATVRADRRADIVVVEITDRGRGFDLAQVRPHRRGISLSISDRMATAGGRAEVESSPGHGTCIRLVWPNE
jgi:signal transduction histidine kinase